MAKHFILLALITFAAFAPTVPHDFINYDDPHYVTLNPMVHGGLSVIGVEWAFTTWHTGYWQPMTWLSLMLDATLFGPDAAWGYRLTNILLHVANALLALRLLPRLTANESLSFLAALLFAVHPLRVESVVWITERKDVLSTFFGLLSLLAYYRYQDAPDWTRYLEVAGWLLLGLASKPMLVTWPVLYWMMDVYRARLNPLATLSPAPVGTGTVLDAQGRGRGVGGEGHDVGRLRAFEKIPLLILAGVVLAVTMLAQRQAGAIVSLSALTPFVRVENALVSLVRYVTMTLWPWNLGIFYPHPRDTIGWAVGLGSMLILLSITIVFFRLRKSRPSLLFGWSWYLVTSIPILGFSQAGQQGWADRFTYVPSIGLSLVLAALLLEACNRLRIPQVIPAWVLTPILLLLTWRQGAFWASCDTLYEHSLQVADSHIVRGLWGVDLTQRHKIAEARPHLRKALELAPPGFPEIPEIPLYLGLVAKELGDLEEAESALREAIRRDPSSMLAQELLNEVRKLRAERK